MALTIFDFELEPRRLVSYGKTIKFFEVEHETDVSAQQNQESSGVWFSQAHEHSGWQERACQTPAKRASQVV